MPSNDFNLLSDREREYLENPNSFDSQTKAEIRYRLRSKWDNIVEDMKILKENRNLWKKQYRR